MKYMNAPEILCSTYFSDPFHFMVKDPVIMICCYCSNYINFSTFLKDYLAIILLWTFPLFWWLSTKFPPRWCLYFDVVVGLVWSNDPENFAGGSIATGRDTHAGQVEGGDPD
jgi:hypothetical protein